MANVYAVKSGNWSDPTVWNTGTLPATVDLVWSNTFTVNIDTSITVGALYNFASAGIPAGGGNFTITNNNIVVTAYLQAGPVTLMFISISSGQNVTINGTLQAGGSNNAGCVVFNTAGNLTIVGNVNGGFASNNTIGLLVSSSGNVTITGNCTGCSSGASGSPGVNNSGSGTMTITGNCISGASSSNYGVLNSGTGTVNITGNCTGNNIGTGVVNSSTGTMSITGSVIAGSGGGGCANTSSGSLTHIGTATANNNVPAITSSSTSTFFSGPFICSANGTHAVLSSWWRWIPTPIATYYQIRSANLSVIRPLYTADSVGGNPSVSNVRSGTTFGPSNELTGTAAIPPVQSVTYGVAVGNTTGTVALNVADIWNYPVSGITTSGSIGERLKTAATVNVMGQLISDSFSAK